LNCYLISYLKQRLHLEKDYLIGRARQKERVESGIPMANLAKRPDMTISAVSYAVQRGEKTVREKGFQLES